MPDVGKFHYCVIFLFFNLRDFQSGEDRHKALKTIFDMTAAPVPAHRSGVRAHVSRMVAH